MSIFRASRAARTGFEMTYTYLGLGFIRHERRCCMTSLSLRAGLWELAGVLERTDAAGACDTQGLKAGDDSKILP